MKTKPRQVSNASVAPVKSGEASATLQPSALNVFLWGSRTLITADSTGRPPRSRLQAILVFRKFLFRERLKIEPGSVIATGERGSGPAIAESRNAASATVRAIGPSSLMLLHGFACG